MTRHQVDKFTDPLNQIALAAVVGPIGDITLVGTRVGLDMLGLAVSGVLMWVSYRLTAWMGGPRL